MTKKWTRETSLAFMHYPEAKLEFSPTGALSGMTFTVKDMFDVKGYPTSAGNPTMLALSALKINLPMLF